MHIRNLNQALNHRLVLKKVILYKFNQNDWLNNIDINADLRKKQKMIFKKIF